MAHCVSVIVPVYKAEKYLHRCVDSILAQTFTNFELILVDDGSPDGSGALCDEYAQKDSRVRVIHKENGGVASARQCGIDNATGTYTIHADPDDWVEPTMLEELYNKAIAENADMVICDFYVSERNCNTYIKQEVSDETSQEVLKDLLFHRLHGSLCNKLIKLACYTDNHIKFAEGLNTSEDYLICVKVLKNNPRVAYLNKAFYHYDQEINSDSITHQYTTSTYRMHMLLLEELEKTLLGNYIDALYYQKASIALLAMKQPILTSKEYKEQYKPIYKQLIPYINGFKMKVFFTLSTNGLKSLSCYILNCRSRIVETVKKLLNKTKK